MFEFCLSLLHWDIVGFKFMLALNHFYATWKLSHRDLGVSYSDDETRTRKTLVPRRKANRFGQRNLYD